MIEQRKVISNGISHNYKLKKIAETLDFDPTSISKEVKRNRKSITIGINITNCKIMLECVWKRISIFKNFPPIFGHTVPIGKSAAKAGA